MFNAEAQKKTLQKLTTQKSHSFTAGVKQTDSPVADFCPAKRFDDVVTGSPATTPHDLGRVSDELYDSPKLKALQQKLRRQVAEDHVSSPAESASPAEFSPRINSSFGAPEPLQVESEGSDISRHDVSSWEKKLPGQPARKLVQQDESTVSDFSHVREQELPGQPAGKLVQQVMTHTVHTEARTIQRMPVPNPRARTHFPTDSWGSESDAPSDLGAMDLSYQSQTAETHVLAEDVRTISTVGRGALSQETEVARKEVVTSKTLNTGPAQMMSHALGNRGQFDADGVCGSF